MRFLGFVIYLLFFLSCHNSAERPIWINESSKFIFPSDTFYFQSSLNDWSAVLYSFTQPILLFIEPEKDGFRVIVDRNSGIIEGPANLCLISGKNSFIYPINLVNIKDSLPQLVDYRSPKTMNLDSNLQHQSIIHKVDRYQNLERAIGEKYFFEKEHSLSPIVKTYRALADKPLTAYYMQAGSCTNIPIHSSYNAEKKEFFISAGILKDKYGNNIADGSLIRFIYTDGKNTYRQESLVKNGFATAKIPWKNDLTCTLHVETNNVQSRVIELKNSKKETMRNIKKVEVKIVQKIPKKPLIISQSPTIINPPTRIHSKTLVIDE